jgi:L-seryl-tRNA(Ser) seleniumtransferase
MNSRTGSPPDALQNALRWRSIPSVDELLNRPALRSIAEKAGRAMVTDAIRSVLTEIRAGWKDSEASQTSSIDIDAVEARIVKIVEAELAPSLRRVINATGVILHTNLGRAPLSKDAVAEIAATAGHYSNLEYDLSTGTRGKRDVHTAQLLADLAGAESAIVVNNNAAAIFLVLSTLAKGAEVVVSRGELIEIGDGFRIPEIMAESGAVLREIGTTNRTRIRDYEKAINEHTRLLLRVHPSNFRITGFTERPSLAELAALGTRTHLPVYEDLGSGCVADLTGAGVSEPLVRASCDAGASIVSFSGDKLLGGPQAGVIAGKKDFIERIRRNPLFRALRVDKLTIAALHATLQSYRRGSIDEIPALQMIRTSAEEIAQRSAHFVERLQNLLPGDVAFEVRPGFSVIGGGSTPDQQLPTQLISVASNRHSAAALEKKLRQPDNEFPVIARIDEARLVLDLRTVLRDEESALASALVLALR